MRVGKSMLVGLSCGLLCAACVGLYIAQVDGEAAALRAEELARFGGEQVEVCIARRDIGAGETIGESDLETKTWVASLLPPESVTAKKDAVGKQVATTIFKGEVVTARRFGVASATLDVPDGLTAVSMPAHDVQAIGGALAPGMRVDVYAVGPKSTAKILSSALVLESSSAAAGSSLTSSASWATLAVPPSAVEELVSSAQNLELYFALPGESAGEAPKKEA